MKSYYKIRKVYDDLIKLNEELGGNKLLIKDILELKIFLIEHKGYEVRRVFSTGSLDAIAYFIVDNLGHEGKSFTPEEFYTENLFEGVGVL